MSVIDVGSLPVPHYIDDVECWTPAEIAAWAETSNPHRAISRAGLTAAGSVIAETGQPVKVYRRADVEQQITPGRRRRAVRSDADILAELAQHYPGRVPSIREIRAHGVGAPRDARIQEQLAEQLNQ